MMMWSIERPLIQRNVENMISRLHRLILISLLLFEECRQQAFCICLLFFVGVDVEVFRISCHFLVFSCGFRLFSVYCYA